MLEQPQLETLLCALTDAIEQQNWSRLSQVNRHIHQLLEQQRPDDRQTQQLREAYQRGLTDCQREADSLWRKIQQTLTEREGMAAYACFSDADSFAG